MRRCSRTACGRRAVSTLTYVYADQQAVLGPLATLAEPHTYDLCAEHAARLTAPQGWDVVRLALPEGSERDPDDDLLAVAEVLHDRPSSAQPEPSVPSRQGDRHGNGSAASGEQGTFDVAIGDQRGHLRVLRDAQAGSGER